MTEASRSPPKYIPQKPIMTVHAKQQIKQHTVLASSGPTNSLIIFHGENMSYTCLTLLYTYKRESAGRWIQNRMLVRLVSSRTIWQLIG